MVIKISIFLLLLLPVSSWSKPASTWIYNETRDELIEASDSNIPRPIASLTKIMTALVALEYDSDMSKPMRVAGGSRLPSGINTRGDVFAAMLVRSDNYSSELLARDYPGGRKAFIAAMNRKAREIGMINTRFVDPSGLGAGNVSTVGSVAAMLQVAALQPIIADTSVLPQVEIKNKKYRVLLDNTNKMLLADFNEIKLSKTGFTSVAGWSVGMILERHGQRFVVVVLGAQTKEQRYVLAKKLIERHFADIEYDVAEQEIRKGAWQRVIDWFQE
jgi:serine-type D-Ala-D-Ala endopeptidase (penicillin-binding protein 7)